MIRKVIISDLDRRLILETRHAAPHSVLGMHPMLGGGLVVRVYDPNAYSVRIQSAQESQDLGVELEKIDQGGLFEAMIPGQIEVFAYTVEKASIEGESHISRDPYSFLPTVSDEELQAYGKGEHRRAYHFLGAQVKTLDHVEGTSFTVWAPNARRVSVVGDFNSWDGRCHMMRALQSSGIWEIFIPGVAEGDHYKFEILDAHGHLQLKTDPCAYFYEQAPKNASIVWDINKHQWTDQTWIEKRSKTRALNAPMSIYEMHLGSWKKKSEFESLSYRELAQPLIDYLDQQGFTHVEFLPVAEHAYYPSWGYQVTGFFSPTSRFGTPDDFQYLVDALHQAGFGVIVDWVPAHFPKDTWSLGRFDGTALYEHEDPRKGEHTDWGTYIFNYGRNEVANFLAANALFWLDKFHIDGLRVDAVASMLYLDYSREEGQWLPNQYGGRENLEAIDFLRKFNHWAHADFPGIVTIAEESTAWPQVSRPPDMGGLGFSLKWNMGWMHDTLRYFQRDPIYRKHHQGDLTFGMLYHYHENFILPLSHDEVVHGKGSLLGRMPGDDWQKFANLRCLLSYQWFFPGKNLLFMGGEFGQGPEWNENTALPWNQIQEHEGHRGVQSMIAKINRVYRENPAMWEGDYQTWGFEWIDTNDHDNSVLSFIRKTEDSGNCILVVLNLTPQVLRHYRIGVPGGTFWAEIFNSDTRRFGGSGVGNPGLVKTEMIKSHGKAQSVDLTLPPLSVSAFKLNS